MILRKCVQITRQIEALEVKFLKGEVKRSNKEVRGTIKPRLNITKKIKKETNHLERSERFKGSWSTYHRERSEKLEECLSTNHLERGERLKGSRATDHLE